MTLDDLTLEELSEYVADGQKVVAWRSRATGALDSIDTTFKALEAAKVKYATDQARVDEFDVLIGQLKTQMLTIYQAH